MLPKPHAPGTEPITLALSMCAPFISLGGPQPTCCGDDPEGVLLLTPRFSGVWQPQLLPLGALHPGSRSWILV